MSPFYWESCFSHFCNPLIFFYQKKWTKMNASGIIFFRFLFIHSFARHNNCLFFLSLVVNIEMINLSFSLASDVRYA